MSAILATYIYPAVVKYLPQFVRSVNRQTDRDFQVCIFNDGVGNAGEYFQTLLVPYRVIETSGSPLQIRASSFEYLSVAADQVIFQDSDDQLADNRIAVIRRYLDTYDLVVNDLTLSDEDGKVTSERIWSQRLPNGFIFDSGFLRDKNIVGFGNTGVRAGILKQPLRLSEKPMVADWFIFYQVMINGKVKGCFTTDTVTIYRQHDANTAGIRAITRERILRALSVKTAHYLALNEVGCDFGADLRKTTEMQENIGSLANLDITTNETPFWWEETKLYEKN